MAQPLAAVTGGTGFLGGHIVDAFLAEGWRVRVLSRRSEGDERWRGAAVDTVRGDLGDGNRLRELCTDVQAVVHAAGAIKATRTSAFDEVNVEGAARVAAAAQESARGAAFVLISSLAAREPRLSAYARSKHAGEAAVRQVLGAAVQVVRPCAIYGPGDRATLPLFRAAAASPVLPVLDPRARICLMHARDAARAVVALTQSRPEPDPVELSDARASGYTWREIMRAAADAVGAQPRLVRAPAIAVQAAGRLGDVARRLGASPVLTSGKAREILHADWSALSRADLPAARFDLPSGFSDAVAWYRGRGWLPRSAQIL